jgi:IMP dehydrogenase
MLPLLQDALTFDDVSLVPGLSCVLPRDVCLQTQLAEDLPLNIPLLSAAMDTVTESELAIALAQEGGLGVIHKNLSIAEQVEEVRRVKKFASGRIADPITVTPDVTVEALLHLMEQHDISGVPVVENRQLVGIVTRRDIRFEQDLCQPIARVMTPQERLVTVHEQAKPDDILRLLHQHRIEKILIVNEQGELHGLMTAKDIQKAKDKPLACKNAHGQLRVGAAVGVGEDDRTRVDSLIKVDIDLLVVDTAHGHAQAVIDQVRWIRHNYPNVRVLAGNIVTGEAALALAQAGADAVKVGIGPGSICTTRMVTGVGVPQLTAIANISEALKAKRSLWKKKKHLIPIVADGGIRYSGDIVKALAAGADMVMIGSLFAGTEEAPGHIELYQGRTYKTYRGMGSLGAMAQGSGDRYAQPNERRVDKLVPEGIEGRIPYRGKIQVVVHQLLGGLRSGMGYLGCATLPELHEKAHFVRITPAGQRESHVHDVAITKEAPNYSG